MEVVVFPWLAFGHMIPFLELSKRLAARGHAVTFVSTPRNLARLPPVPPHLSARLRFVSLPLPRVDGLPEGAESTADVPAEKIELVKKAMDGLAAPLTTFLADEAAAAFVAFVGPWWANNMHPRAATEDFNVTPGWIPSPLTIAYRRHNEAESLASLFRTNASGVSDMDRAWGMFERCRLTIYRSCDEVDPGMFALLSDLLRRPAVPAGVLLPPAVADDGNRGKDELLRWLDEQPPKSVIYVALGSEAPLTRKSLHELALGLDLAGVRFLWALRTPAGLFDAGANDCSVLPDGFEERTRGRGMVQTGWVPQVKALAHPATGAFLTHCGWGSTVESFCFGLPLVMLPFTLDQPLVAQAMEEKGIGVEVARDDIDSSFDRDCVAAAVRRVMVDDEGKVLASNARKLQEVLADQVAQERYIDDLVEHLRRHRDDGCQ
uniref:Uncharacterized protein n=1 Tax=Avena sativa TaxID=4498 RepID=A0ACD5X8Y1_AVESA